MAQENDLINLRINFKNAIVSNPLVNIDAIIVQQGDSILLEEYFNGYLADSLHDTRSSFKSITSLLAGIAIDQGIIQLEDRLGKFFPNIRNQNKRDISVRDLLEMRSGLNCEEFYGLGPECEDAMWESDDWIAFCLDVEMIGKSGLNWSYNSIDPMLLGEVISRASGLSVMEFAKQYLFDPLEISNYRWTVSPKGQGMTAGSFFMRPIDMMKIASLVRYNGLWEDQQVISSNWIHQSTACNIPIDYSFCRYSRMSNATYQSARYGFYWYKERLIHDKIDTEVLFASGNGGQYMMIIPDYNLSVVFTGSNYGSWRGKQPFKILLERILPNLQIDEGIK
ncbi:serine hydrolase domain-containing protein [Sphingobacterium corticis]|uniref:Serine hydrolase domain-containing protein n=1 Tax=Sphingobacterium corticis TaxID=1812823 RepID=A0ABW5NFR1_9SPHI